MEWTLERINIPQSFIVLDNAYNTFSCGRNTKNQIICVSLVVSRQHCMFIRDTKTLSVLDLKSSNGVYVNGKLQEPNVLIPLQENDIIGIGSFEEYRDNEPMFIYRVHKGNLGARNPDNFDLLPTQQSTSSSALARDDKINNEEIVIDSESEERHTLKRNHPSRTDTHPSAPKIAKIADKILVIEDDDDDEIFNKNLDKPVVTVPEKTEESDEIRKLWSKDTSSVKMKFQLENPSVPYIHALEANSTTRSGSSRSNINLQKDNKSTILREVRHAENGPHLTSMNSHSAATNKLATETVDCVSSKSKRSITAERDQVMIEVQHICDLFDQSSGTKNDANTKKRVFRDKLTNSARCTVDNSEPVEIANIQNKGEKIDSRGNADNKGTLFNKLLTFIGGSSATKNNSKRKNKVPAATLTNSSRYTFDTLEPTEKISVQNNGSRNNFQGMSDEGRKGNTLSNNPTLSKRRSGTENDANTRNRVSSDTLANSARRTRNIREPTENFEIQNKGDYIDLRGIKDSSLISKGNVAFKCDLQRNNSDDREKPTIPCKTTGRNPLDRSSYMDEIPLAASSPFKEKEAKQDFTTSFSVSDTTNLSDDDEDIFPNSQLFHSTNDAAEFNMDDELFEVEEKQIPDYNSKPEFLDNGEIQDHGEVITLSDSEDDENPWLDRLSRSQRIKEEESDIVEEQGLNDPLLWEEMNKDFFFDEAEEPQVRQGEGTNLEKDGVHPQSPPRTDGPSIPFLKLVAIEKLIGDDKVDRDQDHITQTSDSLHIESVTADKSGDENLGRPPPVKLLIPKGPQIIEPLHLPQKKRRSLKDALEKTDTEILNPPSTSSICNFKVRNCSVELQKLPLTAKQKRQLQMVSRADQKAYEEEQRLRRIKNRWAQNIPLPVGKRNSVMISRTKKSEIINERKEKLKALAAKHKADNQKPSVERIAAKAKAKVTLKTRGDFLITEQQTVSSTKPAAKSSEAAKSKTEEKSPKLKKKSSNHASKSESVKVTKKPTSSAGKSVSKRNSQESTRKKTKDEQSNNKKEPSQKLSPNKENRRESGQKSSPSKQPKKAETPNDNIPKSTGGRPVITDIKTIKLPLGACLKKKKDQLPTTSDKSLIKKKKRVRFSSDLVTVRVFEIDPNNKMKKCVGKDALIPREKLVLANNNVPDDTLYKLEEFFVQIFTWNPSWLEEQRYLQSEPPILNNKTLIPMLTNYRSYKEYYQVMSPPMLIELWQGMTREFENINKNYRRKTVYCSVVSNSVSVQKISGPNLEMTSMMLEVLASNEDIKKQCHPMFGDLVYVELCYKNDEKKQCFLKVFAYITNMIRKAITPNTFFNRDLHIYTPKPDYVLTFTVITRLLKVDVCTNRLSRLRCVTYLRSNMRMVQALQYLPKSPLVNLIVNPRIEDYQLSDVEHQSALVTRDSLNHKQLEAVLKATEVIVRRVPKICLIQGPPGTGKSKVIENIVMQVLYGDNRYKKKEQSLRILLCAPSNAAIDEIVLRLLSRRASLAKDRFKMVRVGMQGPMHPRVREISVEELAKRLTRKAYAGYTNSDSCVDSLEDEKRYLEARINAINMELTSSRLTDMCHVQCLNMKLADLQTKYNLVKNRLQSKDSEFDSREFAKLQRSAENKVLIGADIIACTLSSCYANLMESAFSGRRNKITVCIVDEATQSSEAETLIPLMLGVNTLVLVGDPNQLPATVISQKAKQLGLDQSLFARIQIAFSLQENSPVIMLNMQYRMNPSISYWPNQFFYAGKLRNAHPENEHGLPLRPYRVMDLDSEQDSDKFTNKNEAAFVANVVWSIISLVDCGVAIPIISIAIITPYRNQLPVIQAKVDEKLSPIKEGIQGRIQIDVNTVDSFQGQERDIVVMSCVRSNGLGFLADRQRLCVALTRAKQSLVLCGNFKNFVRDPMWSALLYDASTRGHHVPITATAPPAEIIPHLIK
ncbi:probable helicase senataxin [Athalia rosae]|uniref:probable helicase senataxin n=1 Tax=Athalia rosae TaxID=37344 RepID=UPI002033EAF7|nr:probable helicase senataxin [Athalia rosae]